MKDPEFIALRNRFVVALIITIIIVIPLGLFVITRFSNQSTILKSIKNKDDVVIFITSNKCLECPNIKTVLDSYHVSYIELNKDTDKSYSEIMQKIQMATQYVQSPGLIYLEEGQLYANYMNLTESKTKDFIASHHLQDTIKEK